MRDGKGNPRKEGRGRRIALIAAMTLCLYLGLESFLPAARQPSVHAVVGAIHLYQSTASPALGKFVHCKFEPTCSHYGEVSILKYGTIRGSLHTAARLWRCSPWGPAPGQDLP